MPNNVKAPPDYPDRHKPSDESRAITAIVATCNQSPAAAAIIVRKLGDKKADVLEAYEAKDVPAIAALVDEALAELRPKPKADAPNPSTNA